MELLNNIAFVSLTVDNKTIENIKGKISFSENNEGLFRIELNG